VRACSIQLAQQLYFSGERSEGAKCGDKRLGAKEVGQAISILLIALGLSLTGYLGLEAWRSSEDNSHTAIGTALPSR
jgi:hypothetical protein